VSSASKMSNNSEILFKIKISRKRFVAFWRFDIELTKAAGNISIAMMCFIVEQ
jgi:hypothetical protein